MAYNVEEFAGEIAERIAEALEEAAPGLVTTTQRGFLAPDAEAIAEGFIKLATSSNKGLMSKAFAEMLENPESIVLSGQNVLSNAGYHNSIYCPKYLGSRITDEQSAEIRAGTFRGMWVGSYWTINGHTHTIAAFDPNWNVGDTALQTHHVGVVSDGGWSSAWYTSNDTSRGYVSTETGTIRKYIKDTVEPAIIADFGSSHVLSYRALYPSAYSSGAATGWAWVDAKSELLSEVEVFGAPIWSSSPYETGHGTAQLPLFRLYTAARYRRANWWLRSVRSATGAAIVYGYGGADGWNASNVFAVRPLSLIA